LARYPAEEAITPLPDIRRLRAHLKSGGVIAYATESCYGLGCDPANRNGVRRILQLKGRPQNKGLILIGSDVNQFERYLAAIPAWLIARLGDWWPGPNTLVLATSVRCPHWLKGRHSKLAVRVTAHREAARLCHELGMALVSTSANRSGRRALKSAAACSRCFGSRILVLNGRIGQSKRPSRIIDPDSGKVFRN
jgi:L-threonylcarbamoyladenylate synthase